MLTQSGSVWFLFLTTVLPRGGSGGEIVTQSVIDALVETGNEVRVLGYRRPEDRSAGHPRELDVGARPIETSTAGPRSLAWMVAALARNAPYSVTKYRSRAYLRGASRALTDGPAIVFLDHAQVHFGLSHARSASPPLVFIAHNAEAASYKRLAAAAGHAHGRWVNRREARVMRQVESDLSQRSRQVWALTEEDAVYFRALAPQADVRTLEVPSLSVRSSMTAPVFDIGLIGSWSWRPNAIGLEWFSAEVVPHLLPHLRIQAAGKGAEWLRDRHLNLTVTGAVPDAQRFLSQGRVVAVPARVGSGIQVKTLDAIASGLPVVATSVAVRGLGELPSSVSVVDDAEEFAARLSQLATAECDRPDPAAAVWSDARAERFRRSLAGWIDEMTPSR